MLTRLRRWLDLIVIWIKADSPRPPKPHTPLFGFLVIR
jgi:hypothetical protein